MIQVEGLTKFYGARRAVDNLTFEVKKGEILGFLGPNGAGKSTTMKILTCFIPPTAGKAHVAGFDIYTNSFEIKKRIGYLPETPPVYTDMVVEDYLDYAASLHGLKAAKKSQSVKTVLEKCNLGHVRGRLIRNLSKGYRQRVGIAQAIVHNPSVLILDEPTVGLDPSQIVEIRDLIKTFSGDHTVILSTHILPEVQATCSRVLIINEGRVVAIDQIDRILARQKGRAVRIVTKRAEGVEASLKSTQGVELVSGPQKIEDTFVFTVTFRDGADPRDQLAESVVRSGAGLLELKPEGVSLEEVFLRLTS